MFVENSCSPLETTLAFCSCSLLADLFDISRSFQESDSLSDYEGRTREVIVLKNRKEELNVCLLDLLDMA